MDRTNNFNIIRLLAAFQVALWHTINHLELNTPAYIGQSIKYFPGVPIFFVISGFLLYQSFDKNPFLGRYIRNRIRRIYPALWVAFLVSFTIITCFGYYTVSLREFARWMFSQLTVFQNYTPASIRSYALHDPNPPLWTIPVEISFYVFVPLCHFACKRFKLNRTVVLLILIALSYAFNYYLLTIRETQLGLFQAKNKTLTPYLFYFLLGALVWVNWEHLKRFYLHKAGLWLVAYLTYVLVVGVLLEAYEQLYWINGWGFIAMVLLAQLTISAAYTLPHLSNQLIGHTDISYGVYLYHMIVVNLIYQLGYLHHPVLLVIVLTLTTGAAFLSWKWVERPLAFSRFRAAGAGNNNLRLH